MKSAYNCGKRTEKARNSNLWKRTKVGGGIPPSTGHMRNNNIKEHGRARTRSVPTNSQNGNYMRDNIPRN